MSISIYLSVTFYSTIFAIQLFVLMLLNAINNDLEWSMKKHYPNVSTKVALSIIQNK